MTLAIPFNESSTTDNELEVLYGVSATSPPSRGWLEITDTSLPSGVLAIGRFYDDSLLCLSTREQDHGSVYYWDYYWKYPWRRGFFTDRVHAAYAPFGDYTLILDDASHPKYESLNNAAHEAVLYLVADDFEKTVENFRLPDA